MEFCVLVKVSRRTVTFWYQTEDKGYSPLAVKGIHEVPLYFHVDNNQFNWGSQARERFYNHDPNAFGRYFEIIQDPSCHFILQNSPRRVKQLLYYGIEQYLTHFLNTVLYKSDSIESYRPTFPIKFIFEPDLGEPERNLVELMFTEAGYRTVHVENYNNRLLEHLRAINYVTENQDTLMLTGLDNTLYLDLYLGTSQTPINSFVLPDQGSDPRIRILAEMILGYINEQNPYLNLDINLETSSLLPLSAAILSKPAVIVTGEAELTNGSRFWFRVNLKAVEDRAQYYRDDLIVTTSINTLLQNCGVRSNNLTILLCSEQIDTSYFTERLLKQYPLVKSVAPIHIDGAMQIIFKKVSQSEFSITPPLVQVPKLPPSLSAKKQLTPVQPAKPPLPIFQPQGAIIAPAKPPLPVPKTSLTEQRPKTIIPPLPPANKKLK